MPHSNRTPPNHRRLPPLSSSTRPPTYLSIKHRFRIRTSNPPKLTPTTNIAIIIMSHNAIATDGFARAVAPNMTYLMTHIALSSVSNASILASRSIVAALSLVMAGLGLRDGLLLDRLGCAVV